MDTETVEVTYGGTATDLGAVWYTPPEKDCTGDRNHNYFEPVRLDDSGRRFLLVCSKCGTHRVIEVPKP